MVARESHARKRVVVLPGEDAAPEAVLASVRLLEKLGLDIEWQFPRVGRPALDADGTLFPDAAREAIDAADATLFGATSGPSAVALLYLRWGKRTYANVRPNRWLPGMRSPLARPEDVDLVIVRENLEDLYVGVEGELADLDALGLRSLTAQTPLTELGEGRFAVKAVTRDGTARVARFAFELARRRRQEGHPGHVTCGTKHNMLPRSDGFFREVTRTVAAEFPDVPLQTLIVDDLAHRLVREPGTLDVVLLPNLYGDILSDAAAGLAGGLGLAPSGCYGDDYAYFESAHGTAPDLTGQDVINPTATLLSAAMLLDYLQLAEAGEAIRTAIARVYAQGAHLTPDQGGHAGTGEFCRAVEACL